MQESKRFTSHDFDVSETRHVHSWRERELRKEGRELLSRVRLREGPIGVMIFGVSFFVQNATGVLL